MISSRSQEGRLPPGGGTIEKLAAGLTTRRDRATDTTLAHFELPDVFLDSFTPPLEQLGYTVAQAMLPAGRAPRPVSYTSAKKSRRELQLLNLPPIFFEPREEISFMASGLFSAFDPDPQLHLWAEGRESVLAYFDSVLKLWNRQKGVPVAFHPWSRLDELRSAPDPTAFVASLFDLNDNGAATGSVRLAREQYNVLYESLIGAINSFNDLRSILRRELGRRLHEMTSEASDLTVNVMDVIEDAEAKGWIGDLVGVAVNSDRANNALKRVAAELGVDLGAQPAGP